MTNLRGAAALAALLVAIAGCGERSQTMSGSQKKSDAKAWEGGTSTSVAGGWKAGDKSSWEEEIRARTQGQNEYSRSASTNSQP
jgi:hypothetical protein